MRTIRILSILSALLLVGWASIASSGEERRARAVEKWDANKDGELDESERAAMREARQQQRTERSPESKARMLERWDANKDGVLDESERDTKRKHRKGEHGKRDARALEKWDADGNGELDENERAARKEAHAEKRAKLLAEYDADHDGSLSESERSTAIEAGAMRPHKKHWRGGRHGRDGDQRPRSGADAPGRSESDRADVPSM